MYAPMCGDFDAMETTAKQEVRPSLSMIRTRRPRESECMSTPDCKVLSLVTFTRQTVRAGNMMVKLQMRG